MFHFVRFVPAKRSMLPGKNNGTADDKSHETDRSTSNSLTLSFKSLEVADVTRLSSVEIE
jgi:hypothetical protein